MTLEEALREYMLSQASVTALVGERIYHGEAPVEAEQPLVVVRRVDTPRDYTHLGASGLAWPRLQLTIHAAREADALRVAEALRAVLSGYRGMMGSVDVQGVFVVNEYDGYLFGTRRYERILDVIVWHTEAKS